MRIDGNHFDVLIAEMETVLQQFTERIQSALASWHQGRPSKWTLGQHADHIAAGLRVTADAFEGSERDLRAGVLGTPPRRWPPEALFIATVVGIGFFPRGARAPRVLIPRMLPEPDDVMARVAADVPRFRALGQRLTADERDNLWIASPFMKGWHYRFPEIVRLHATHTRHHVKQIDEIAAATAD